MTICKGTASICGLSIRRDITKEQISKVGDWTKDFPQEKSTESNRNERHKVKGNGEWIKQWQKHLIGA